MILPWTIRPMSEQVRQATLRAYAQAEGRGETAAPEQRMVEHLRGLGYLVISPAAPEAKAA